MNQNHSQSENKSSLSVKYVFSTQDLTRYAFPTHINDLVMDRSEARHSEVFLL